MPLYEYQCVKCHKRTEKIEGVDGPHLKKCPHCGGKVERLQSAPAIQFKGSGWYVTDYAGKKSAGGDSSSAGKGEQKEPSNEQKDAAQEKKEASKETAEEAPKESAAKESKDSREKKTAKK